MGKHHRPREARLGRGRVALTMAFLGLGTLPLGGVADASPAPATASASAAPSIADQDPHTPPPAPGTPQGEHQRAAHDEHHRAAHDEHHRAAHDQNHQNHRTAHEKHPEHRRTAHDRHHTAGHGTSHATTHPKKKVVKKKGVQKKGVQKKVVTRKKGVAGTPCTDIRVKACVDLSSGRSWLLDGKGHVLEGPVPDSTGAAGHRTPTGDFVVQWKDRNHVSSEYKDAPMPYSVFFDKHGRAFHGGSLQRKSSGCVHLTEKDARSFYDHLKAGDRVQIVQ